MAIRLPESLKPSNPVLITYIVLASVAVLLNIICIAVITKQRQKLKSFEILLINLMAADIITAVTAMLLALALLLDLKEIAGDGFTVIAFIFVAISQEMTFIILLISLNRFVAVKYPLKHRFNMTRKRTLSFSGITWLLFVVYLSAMLITTSLRKASENPFEVPDAPRIIFIIITCSFAVIFIAVSIETLRLILRRRAVSQNNDRNRAATRCNERSLCITTGLIITCYILCTTPRVYQLARKKVEVATVAAVLTNCIMNPLLYYVNGKLRRHFRETNRSQEHVRDTT